MTLIVLLILAAVSLSSLFSEKGLFGRAENAGNRYNEAKAREVLETVLLTDGQMEKQTNSQYNQDDFLDDLIKKEIEGSDVKGDVAIIGEYAYELDRSVPKIGHYLGKVTDLIFPAVTVAETIQADTSDNYRTAKIEITATIDEKASNGINRIEIWQNGVKLSTITCNNEKIVTTEYRATRNGVYIIKAYSKISNTEMPNAEISGSARTTVEGIVPAVEFIPNGSTEWKKRHTTTVKVRETEEKVTEMKYLWKKSDEAEPKANEFTENCTNNSIITGQGETMTGKYKLWVSVTLGTEANQRTYVNGSDEFYFDNEGPIINSLTSTGSEEDLTLLNFNINAYDDESGINKIEIYLGSKLLFTKMYDNIKNIETSQISINNLPKGEQTYKIYFYDFLGNSTIKDCKGRCLEHKWGHYVTGTRKWYKWAVKSIEDGTTTWANYSLNSGPWMAVYTDTEVSYEPWSKAAKGTPTVSTPQVFTYLQNVNGSTVRTYVRCVKITSTGYNSTYGYYGFRLTYDAILEPSTRTETYEILDGYVYSRDRNAYEGDEYKYIGIE